ncbi:hypothetical protein [Paraglaciecola sp. 2405UD69-4]|uniref:hypothetical protein n=1 Tax=Paraglaciecola sp. 2405UD69-4 TaxID=3391836 RepID=UPI0039C9934C
MKIQVTIEKFNILYLISFLIVVLIPLNILVKLEDFILPAWLSLFLFTYLLGLLFWLRAKDFLYASLLVFFYVFLLLAPLIQISNGSFPWGTPWAGPYSTIYIVEAWWMTFLSLLFFEVGYVLFRKFQNKESGNVIEPLLSNRGKIILVGVAVVCTIVGLAVFGGAQLFLPRNAVVEGATFTNTSIGPIISAIFRVPAVIIFLLFLYDLISQIKYKDHPKNIKFSLWLLVFIFLIIAIINNPISTPRFWVGAIFLSSVLLYLLACNKLKAASWFMLNVAILVAVFPIMDVYRKSLDSSFIEAVSNINPEGELADSPDFDAFQQQVNSIVVRDISDFSMGNQTLSSLFFFVPRAVWSNKSLASGVVIAELMEYDFKNLSAPLFTEFYLDGWFFGVCMGMFLLGALYRKVQTMHIYRKTPLPAIFYCFFCAYQVYFLRGSLMAVVGFLFVAILLFSAINIFKRLFYKPI